MGLCMPNLRTGIIALLTVSVAVTLGYLTYRYQRKDVRHVFYTHAARQLESQRVGRTLLSPEALAALMSLEQSAPDGHVVVLYEIHLRMQAYSDLAVSADKTASFAPLVVKASAGRFLSEQHWSEDDRIVLKGDLSDKGDTASLQFVMDWLPTGSVISVLAVLYLPDDSDVGNNPNGELSPAHHLRLVSQQPDLQTHRLTNNLSVRREIEALPASPDGSRPSLVRRFLRAFIAAYLTFSLVADVRRVEPWRQWDALVRQITSRQEGLRTILVPIAVAFSLIVLLGVARRVWWALDNRLQAFRGRDNEHWPRFHGDLHRSFMWGPIRQSVYAGEWAEPLHDRIDTAIIDAAGKASGDDTGKLDS